MKLSELIKELRKYEYMYGNFEVVTYYDMPSKNPKRNQGSKIMIVDNGLEQKSITWENSY